MPLAQCPSSFMGSNRTPSVYINPKRAIIAIVITISKKAGKYEGRLSDNPGETCPAVKKLYRITKSPINTNSELTNIFL
jgi:hypothetical protein